VHRLVPRCAGDGALDNFNRHQRVSAAPVAKQWEYKSIIRELTDVKNGKVVDVNDWYEDGTVHQESLDMNAKLRELGSQGRELVSATPRSTLYNTGWDLDFVDSPNGHHPGKMSGEMENGYDNLMYYYFKRPKQ